MGTISIFYVYITLRDFQSGFHSHPHMYIHFYETHILYQFFYVVPSFNVPTLYAECPGTSSPDNSPVEMEFYDFFYTYTTIYMDPPIPHTFICVIFMMMKADYDDDGGERWRRIFILKKSINSIFDT